MKTVYKYPFKPQDRFTIDMPVGASFMHVDVQDGVPCIWASVETNMSTKPYRFRLAGTGHSIGAPDLSYLGTFILSDGRLVFHLFSVEDDLPKL